jgi:hypothetical protein
VRFFPPLSGTAMWVTMVNGCSVIVMALADHGERARRKRFTLKKGLRGFVVIFSQNLKCFVLSLDFIFCHLYVDFTFYFERLRK